jgi:hypothetical protein
MGLRLPSKLDNETTANFRKYKENIHSKFQIKRINMYAYI